VHAVARDAGRISFGYQIRVLARRIDRAMAQRMAPHGVTLPQYYILRELFREDGITQRELSARLEATEPATLVTLRRMEENGLVLRARDTVDRRKIAVYLTRKGKRLRTLLREHARDVNALARGRLTDEDIARFRAILDRMSQNVQL
jgi:DNA-binding MarR family transcriptional regulator